jgi:hypothetical protein
VKKKPDEVAYAEAFHGLLALLERHQVPHAHTVAHDWMRTMVEAGWRHVRPQRDVEPPKGPPAPPEAVPVYVQQAREALREGGESS